MLRERFQNIPLKRKIQLIIFGCIFFISAIAFLSIFCISKAHNQVLYRSLASNLSYSGTEIHNSLQEVDELADLILANSTIQNELSAILESPAGFQKQQHETTVYNTISQYLSDRTSKHISYISILQENSHITTSRLRSEKVPYELRQVLLETGQKGDGSTLWVTDYSQKYGLFLVKELREWKSMSLRPLGTLLICIDLDSLIPQTSLFQSSYGMPSFLLSDGSRTIYSTENLSKEETAALLHSEKGYHISDIGGTSVFSVAGSIADYGWDYTAMVSYESIARTVTVTVSFCIFAILLSLALSALFSSRMVTFLTRHFDWLIEKMHWFGDGNYTPLKSRYDYSRRKDEIGQLHTNFDAMAVKLEALIQENYVNELLKKEAQLKALESQMDPHFLYNTLDSIHWRATAAGASDISQITTALGNLLRISLGKNREPFTLKDEKRLVENYMAIQKLRYLHRLDYSMDLPEKYQDLLIPKFTIQPLLENAIRYGVEKSSEVCRISLRAYTEQDTLVIEVKNSGSSFPENLLERLDTQELQPHGFGIGLLNIQKRLKIAYGEAYGLEVWNTENDDTEEEFAVVRVFLPTRTQKKG